MYWTRPPVSIGSLRQGVGEVETIERDQRNQRVINVSNEALKELGVLHIAAPDRMVAPDPKALDKGVGEDDPLIELPRQFTIGVHLNGVLDSDGNPAKSRTRFRRSPSIISVRHRSARLFPDWEGLWQALSCVPGSYSGRG